MYIMNEIIKEKIPIFRDSSIFPYKTMMYSVNPPIMRISNVLTKEECLHIIELARDKLGSSTMVLNNSEVVNSGRNSKSAFITRNGSHPVNDVIVHSFLDRLSKICGYPVNHFEGMKVVNYQKGQRYYAHFDFFRENDKFTKDVGDRLLTFFVYLNTLEPEDGGTTSFPNLKITSQPQAGDIVFWANMDFSGNYFEDTLHSGDEVLTDVEKWGINVWVRQQPYKN
jgi:prolyl 4-hydroxylase